MNYRMSFPPGYYNVDVPGTGDCLFHALYYALRPEEGVEVAKEKASADAVRKIIADTATIDNILGFNSVNLIDAFRGAKPDDYDSWVETLQLYEEMNASGFPNNNNERRQEKLRIYKEAVVSSPGYWGGSLEVYLLNEYAAANGIPKICVWDQATEDWYPELPSPMPGDEPQTDYRPILKTKILHFHILVHGVAPVLSNSRSGILPLSYYESQLNSLLEKESNTGENAFVDLAAVQKRMRNLNTNADPLEYNTNYAAALAVLREENDFKAQMNAALEASKKKGGKRTTKKRKHSKKKYTRKH